MSPAVAPWWNAFTAVALAQLSALFVYPVLGWSSRPRLTALLGLGAVVLSLPRLVPDGHPGAASIRFLVAVSCGVTVVKMFDLHIGHSRHGRPPLSEFVRFYSGFNPFDYSYRRWGREPDPGTTANRIRLGRGLVELVVGIIAVRWAFGADLGRHGFLLDHTVKWLCLYPALEGGVMTLTATARLAGRPARDIYRTPILARTPADFWRRYNRPVTVYLEENVLRFFRRRPFTGIALAFFASGVLHEYLVAITIGRIEGYQMAFFSLQGIGVLLTARYKPRGAARWFAVAATLTFNALTLVLFSASAEPILDPLVKVFPYGGIRP